MQSIGKWIEITDDPASLPPVGKDVLVFAKGEAEVARLTLRKTWCNYNWHGDVELHDMSHWMHIQSPASQEESQTMSDLQFSTLQKINLQRAARWHPAGIDEWSVNDWLAAFGGEAGEALNAGKKHRRILSGIQQGGNVPLSKEQAEEQIMEELADTVIYADLVASRLGGSLAEAIVKKFNAISVREGFPERLG